MFANNKKNSKVAVYGYSNLRENYASRGTIRKLFKRFSVN